MTISMIACVTSDMYIGVGNELLISILPDMEYFKLTTMGHVIVMGKNTYLSLPKQKPLPNRVNVIISSTMQEQPEGFIVFHSVEDFIETYKDYASEIFVIGGARIYDAFMPYVSKIYLTHIHRLATELPKVREGAGPLVKFPDSFYDYLWDTKSAVTETYFDKKHGVVRYEFLTLKKVIGLKK